MKLLIAILSILFFTNCNPVKRVIKNREQFEKIGQAWEKEHPCVNDTSTTFLAGKIDSVLVPMLVLDTLLLHKDAATLARALTEKYNYDNTDCERQVKEAYSTAYKQGAYMARQFKVPVHAPDTIVRTVEDVRRVNVLKAENNTLESDKNFYSLQSEQFKTKSIYYKLVSGLLVLALGFSAYFNLKRK